MCAFIPFFLSKLDSPHFSSPLGLSRPRLAHPSLANGKLDGELDGDLDGDLDGSVFHLLLTSVAYVALGPELMLQSDKYLIFLHKLYVNRG